MTLEIITSDALGPVTHGFFTRRGGASSGIFHGLNCGQSSSDQSEIVAINRSRVASAMGTDTEAMRGLRQVHSARAVIADPDRTPAPEADGIVTDRPGLVLSVLTADCQPVLFADPEAGVIGAAHAGWRGALDGVLEATVEAMETLGAERGRVKAVIGPTISQAAYEVGPEFLDAFVNEDPGNTRFFANGAGDRYMFDLPAYGLHRLRSFGVGHAEWMRHCTYADADRFYSYRRTTHNGEADYGRLISTIRL
ncbi:polyphenol oxidase [Oceanicola sp. 22II-s10i]|uniref:peptidoglycan editing factor PgeF n=1 Tax=Oceanicola sp. 22II-s10i TaxID=1317116 RepID=UPI000B51FF53|nr:peptidoglycan editing factor PgeF [Oceanicola sp. 22II-s10i]OWU84276.1 polyphenol oxidase [Oceanicola sp. 22II-s10i]